MTDSAARRAASVVVPSTTGARVLLDELVRLGVGELVLCPGSRSAPFAYEAARRDGRDLSVHVRLDERSAAFHALGAARATGRPAAVVTTSGTAASIDVCRSGYPIGR